MSLQERFNKILENYITCKNSQPGVDQSSIVFEEMEREIPVFLSNLFPERKLRIEGSVGVGRWASVPWIAVFNPKITTSAQKGYYICYLFKQDMTACYLTICHSVTENDTQNNKDIRRFVQEKRDALINFIQSNKYELPENILIKEADEYGTSKRAKEYAKSTIVHLKYEKGNIPSDQQLEIDLNIFMDLYDAMADIESGGANMKKEANPIEEESEKLQQQKQFSLLQQLDSKTLIPHIHNYITSKGFNYSPANIKNLYLSLRSKPFVIISGISGTGKTKIVQLFAESVGATEENGQFTLIPVRPDWSDGSELLGYTDIKGDFIEGPLTKVVREASGHLDRPYFVLLDEMNLARVEYYFSDMLSIMESRKNVGDTYSSSSLTLAKNETFTLPGNVYIIGTVNMDETTHPFSKKVLDRANTIEFNEINLNDFEFLAPRDIVEPVQLANRSLQAMYIHIQDAYPEHEDIVKKISIQLAQINRMLEPINAHVGYRVRDEICFYMIHNMAQDHLLLDENVAFDYCIMQKILPRLTGSSTALEKVLKELMAFTKAGNYPQSYKKLGFMLGRLDEDGFTSFWIS